MIRQLLVVCTANICRSPVIASVLAECLPGVAVSSAGVAAKAGLPADPVATAVLEARKGFDISGHRSRPLIRSMCEAADLILVMERGQREIIQERFKSAWGKTWTLDAGEDVFDPVGYPRHVYDEWLEHILKKADTWANRVAGINGDSAKA
ncbi:low molecular weight phosphotyrosine protein phosphatase [Caballeronia zhejiangensis]|uniref:arsenate reductase/protein-tyrosine-phosphatase family protein n=1 Tax=Caballeronia zhejiangensis TaxID=871203 RepID=UPI001F517AA2|nr:low molecular weight phosphotyrosine protein phosphatase [Caballeronia zhejiangensis]MCI1047000.1 low molecular weight phosphotyrosine protein phosphatase [Caballeronia zhejiangensis]